jgi:hypothetical protein
MNSENTKHFTFKYKGLSNNPNPIYIKIYNYYIYMSKLNYKYTILYTFVSLLLFWLIMKWLYFLTNNYYLTNKKNNNLVESFDTNSLLYYDTNSSLLSKSVDLPINTRLSCSNFCGPKGTCAITGTQCLADIDCYGCSPKLDKPPEYLTTTQVKPYFGSGALIYNQNPQYSELTTDIGTRASLYNLGSNTPKMYLGVDKWTKSFNYGLKLADDKLTYQYSVAPEPYRFLPTYPVTETATGLFYDTGPTASNAYL